MLASILVTLFNVWFCTCYVLTLIYCGPYLAVVQFFHTSDPVDRFVTWSLNELERQRDADV